MGWDFFFWCLLLFNCLTCVIFLIEPLAKGHRRASCCLLSWVPAGSPFSVWYSVVWHLAVFLQQAHPLWRLPRQTLTTPHTAAVHGWFTACLKGKRFSLSTDTRVRVTKNNHSLQFFFSFFHDKCNSPNYDVTVQSAYFSNEEKLMNKTSKTSCEKLEH